MPPKDPPKKWQNPKEWQTQKVSGDVVKEDQHIDMVFFWGGKQVACSRYVAYCSLCFFALPFQGTSLQLRALEWELSIIA